MQTLTPSALLTQAEKAARTAGDHAYANRHRRREVHQTFQHDIKLKLDIECQAVAEEVIRSAYPDHDVLGEESAETVPEGSAPLWIIDPIDGTINFYHGLPYWCSSVAVRHEGRVLAGAVYLPATRECYTATLDGPACLNGEPIQAGSDNQLDTALILTGLTKDFEVDRETLPAFEKLSRNCFKTRIQGAAAADICQVAQGRAGGFFESCLYTWDVAAAGLIAERAGARCLCQKEDGSHRLRFLCAAPGLYSPLCRLLGINA